ncbi:hypothetical protein PR048_033149 [Dryococelus australis]|uniref:AB hydrolase-1 domain-containing protein n=1 Tax=Dryococelus australis TaxID=614101 RepID=A0ABQ9FZF6_9NEOP|nr:hypothetical protein PR048_033149 [Dryococelus australis]
MCVFVCVCGGRFHEAGTRDLPVVIDHVLEATGEQQLLLVAHSTGATSALAMCTSLPAACSKVRGIVSMAAVVSSRPSSRALLRPLGSCLTSFKVLPSLSQSSLYAQLRSLPALSPTQNSTGVTQLQYK